MTTKEFVDRADQRQPFEQEARLTPNSVHRPTLVEAQAVVRTFLQDALPDVHRIDVTRVMPIEFNGPLVPSGGGWEVDALVWQPNATIQALGLSTERAVLDQNFYVVRLDGQLNVIGYETKESERST